MAHCGLELRNMTIAQRVAIRELTCSYSLLRRRAICFKQKHIESICVPRKPMTAVSTTVWKENIMAYCSGSLAPPPARPWRGLQNVLRYALLELGLCMRKIKLRWTRWIGGTLICHESVTKCLVCGLAHESSRSLTKSRTSKRNVWKCMGNAYEHCILRRNLVTKPCCT